METLTEPVFSAGCLIHCGDNLPHGQVGIFLASFVETTPNSGISNKLSGIIASRDSKLG